MATALDDRHRTLADFLAWEEQQPERYERVGGRVRMMTGGTIDHGRITRNVALALDRRLRGRDCEVFTSDIKAVSPEDDVMYPDVLVACGELAGKATRLEAPFVLVEVLREHRGARPRPQALGLSDDSVTQPSRADRSVQAGGRGLHAC